MPSVSFLSSISPKVRNALLSVVLALIAIGHAMLAVLATKEKSATFDEIVHVTGGYTFNVLNDYRLHPENGLLPQRWEAFPAAFGNLRYPDLKNPAWASSNAWQIGQRFFYETGNDPSHLLITARAMNSLFGLVTVLLVAAWAGHLFGIAGALSAAFFAALCPTMLAHSGLATSDMAMTFFFLAALSAYWIHLHDGRSVILILSSLIFALACLAKFTAVLLPPIFLVVAFVRCTKESPLILFGRKFSTGFSKAVALAISASVHGAVAALVIWTFSGFRYAAFNPLLPPGEFALSWASALANDGWKEKLIDFCRVWHLLPEGYLYGFAYVLKNAEARVAFLDGQYRLDGWVSFFPKAFLYKTPPSLLLTLIGGGGFLLLWARVKSFSALCVPLYRAAPLITLFIIYAGVSVSSHLNIGHRHILPLYPALYIFAGIVGWIVVRAWNYSRTAGRIVAVLGLVLGGWHSAISWNIYPHYLAYFNTLAGGPSNGYKHLVDSSLDWGQDLPGLKKWLSSHRKSGEPVFLSYFGTADPSFYLIHAIPLPSYPPIQMSGPVLKLQPGIYAISATMLMQVYGGLQDKWTFEMETEYQQLKAVEAGSFKSDRDESDHQSGNSTLVRARYEQLRFARLCMYLRIRRPDDNIGYSILIFRLGPDEVAAVTGSLPQWVALIDGAISRQFPD